MPSPNRAHGAPNTCMPVMRQIPGLSKAQHGCAHGVVAPAPKIQLSVFLWDEALTLNE